MKRQVYDVYQWHQSVGDRESDILDLKKELDVICLEFDGHPWQWDKHYKSSDVEHHNSLFHVRAAIVCNSVSKGYIPQFFTRGTHIIVPENMEDKELINRFNEVYGLDAVRHQTNGAQDYIERYDLIIRSENREAEVPVLA